jgi:D-3-phosphoglycerate dehydrogenase / 2-oxoglutarate reductase
MRILCLTPVKHIAGVYEALCAMGEVAYHPAADYFEALKLAQDADALFLNPNKMNYRIDQYFLLKCPVQYIVTASTGTNHIDVDYAIEIGKTVISLTREYWITEKISSTAEHAFALTLALIRNIPRSFDAAKTGNWDYEPYIGRQLDNLRFGIIGFGRLGTMYARYANAFSDTVSFYDPHKPYSIRLEDIQEYCDVISLHVHLKPDTEKMVNKQFLNNLKRKPYLINTSRGGIVDEQAVVAALESGLISGYATDVLQDELGGNIQENVIVQAAKRGLNVIVTPHIGGMTKEAQELAYHGAIDAFEREVDEDIVRLSDENFMKELERLE